MHHNRIGTFLSKWCNSNKKPYVYSYFLGRYNDLKNNFAYQSFYEKETAQREKPTSYYFPFSHYFIQEDHLKKETESHIKSNEYLYPINYTTKIPWEVHIKKREPTLLFSWLKTIRKKQYYKIIGKIGIKKKNAGMYWSFYVNKRKKIRKKKRTI